ncbi:MAG: hypothetical protein ACRC33_29255 [Gemmataceae bacterium]
MAAAPPFWKVVFFINFGDRGFTETYYKASQEPIPAVNAQVNALALARARLLGGPSPQDNGIDITPSLVAIRVGIVGKPGVTALKFTTPDISAANKGNGKSGPIEVGVNLLMHDANRQYRRIHLLRCLPWVWQPDDFPGDRSVEVESTVFRDRANEFMRVLRGQGENSTDKPRWALKVVDKAEPAPRIKILKVLKDGNPARFVLELEEHTFKIGDDVKVEGVRGPGTKGLAGTHIVKYVAFDRKVTLAEVACDVCTPKPTNFGKISLVKLDYPDIAHVKFYKWGNRKTGRNFFDTRGRRSARKG